MNIQCEKLGAISSELVVVSNFFDLIWSKPIHTIRDDTKANNLNTAGYCLRALGRLTEAVQPMQAALERDIALEDWDNAAI